MDITVEGNKFNISYDDYARLRGFYNMNSLISTVFNDAFSIYGDKFIENVKKVVIMYEIGQAVKGDIVSDSLA